MTVATTLADLARITNLSVSTVSRALSDPGKVNEQTRQRVVRAAMELGYTPAAAATGGRTGLIALVVPSLMNPFVLPFVRAVQERARAKGRFTVLVESEDSPAEELRLVKLIRGRVDGVILVAPAADEGELTDLTDLGPVVVFNRPMASISTVTLDESAAIDQAVEHLGALGHTRIAYLAGPRRSWTNAQRREGVERSCAARGLEMVELGPFAPEVQAGLRAADLLVVSGASAAIAHNEHVALGLIARLAERGIAVGDDVSVISFHDAQASGTAYPSLTAIQTPGAEAGTASVDLLLELITSPDLRRSMPGVELEARLVVRGSTGVAVRVQN